MTLTTYRRKRNFRRTPEPRGDPAPRRERWRFVVQKHAATRLHYDFRLELDQVLKSWAVPKGPSLDPAQKRLAVEVEDHPIEYGDFEGAIPEEQYGGGSVLLWDRGTWRPRGDPHEGLKKGHLSFELHGEKLAGSWSLIRIRGRDGNGKNNWLLIKERDRWVRSGGSDDIVESRPESVKSRRLIEEIGNGKVARRGARRGSREEDVWVFDRPARTGRRRSQRKPRLARAHLDPASLPGAHRSALPAQVAPQLATLVAAAPEGDEWLHEIKYVGYRAHCRVERGQAKLLTRTGQDWTARFRAVAAAAAELPVQNALLDGEIVMLQPDGSTSFQALQNVLRQGRGGELVYFVFDLLHLDGYDLRAVPLESRKATLEWLLEGSPPLAGNLRYSDHIAGRGREFYEEACRRGLEGVVSKRRDDRYASGRTRSWLKTKCSSRQEFVIGGYTEPQGSRKDLGALLLGVREAGKGLRYAGRVGTGFTQESLRDLRRRLDRLRTSAPPFENPPSSRGVHWARPELVAEISFTERTEDGMLRHPSFQGLREDKPPREVVLETPGPSPPRNPVREPGTRPPAKDPPRKRTPVHDPGGEPPSKEPPRKRPPVREPDIKPPGKKPPGQGPDVPVTGESAIAGVALSHPHKVLYPEQGLTKLDLARYIQAVSPFMVPQVATRPLMVLRCPGGRREQCFFQKHLGRGSHHALHPVDLRDAGDSSPYFMVRDEAGLVALVQMGVLEVHVWGACADRIEQPDRIVFDLDPDPAVPWPDIVASAHLLRERLARFGLESFLKTTGGKGLHVVVPTRRGPGWNEAKLFSAAIASSLVREDPLRFTTHLSKARRGGRIFIDTLRNRRGATWVAPYSPRARAGAPVSAPLDWSQLTPRLRPETYHVASLPRLLGRRRKDAWSGIDSVRQTITSTIVRSAQGESESRRGSA